ncbi:MAG: hypothetical protein GY777_04865 [Candidatus Brocadiaceae bacterium]|nr:hypothetical protein [Candidatus Brocadiaceae bacterium]
MNKIILLFILIFSGLTLQVQAMELKQEFKTEDGFTMYLPESWVEIPNEFLKQYSEKVSQLAPQIGKQIYDYGFQLTPVDTWMTYPYILVQVKRTGRISEEALGQYKQINDVFSGQIEEVGNSISSILSNTQLGETLYDTANQILWINISFNLQETGKVNAQIAVKLTEFGVVQIIGYATENTFASFQPLYQEVARRISLDDAIKYKPRLVNNVIKDEGTNSRILIAVLLGTIIGVVIGLTIWFIKRRKRVS